jgi:hypothetical protein
MLQAILTFILYLLLRGSISLLPRLVALSRRRQKTSSDPPPRGKPTTLLSKLAASGLASATTSSLVEFQEMQVYFVASVQIATLVSYNPSTTEATGANNASYAAMLLNSGLAALLGISSLSCVLLVQCCLQRTRMHWWYTFALMTYAFVFAIVLFTRRSRLMPPAATLWHTFQDGTLLPMCGLNPTPMTFCKPSKDTSFLDNSVGGYVVCGVGGLAWLGLFIDQLATSVPPRFPAIAKRLANIKQRLFHGGNRFWMTASRAYWVVLEFALFSMAGYHISQLVLVLRGVDFAGASSWTFGQYIAVSVWAPTIAKFIYTNICKSPPSLFGCWALGAHERHKQLESREDSSRGWITPTASSSRTLWTNRTTHFADQSPIWAM